MNFVLLWLKRSLLFKTPPASLDKLTALILLTFDIAQVNLALPSLKAKFTFGRLKSTKLVEIRPSACN